MENSLKNKTVKGTFWSAIERFSSMGVQIVCTIIIARFLSPTEFGIIGILLVFTTIGQVIVECGFGQALIRKLDATDIDYSSVFYLNIFLGLLVYLLLYLVSPFIADFYKLPILNSASKITFLTIPISSFSMIQYTILVKNTEFKRLALITVLSSILSGGIAVLIAYYYRNVWALIIQNVLMYFFRTIFLWLFSYWTPILCFSILSVKTMFRFSAHLLLSGLIGNIFDNIYALVIGKVYRPVDLGYFSQADKMKQYISGSITEVIKRVTYPILSTIQNDDNRLKDEYNKIIMVSFFIVGFFMFLLMGISRDLFIFLLGEKWETSGHFFCILCINGALYPLHLINQNILYVKGRSSAVLKLELFRRLLMLVIIFITVHFDMIYMIWGSVIYNILLLFVNLYYCGSAIKYSVFEQLKDIFPIILFCVIMFLLMSLCNSLLVDLLLVIRMLIVTVVGGVFFISMASFTHLKPYIDLVSIVKTMVYRKSL